jgi:hypothetical protein
MELDNDAILTVSNEDDHASDAMEWKKHVKCLKIEDAMVTDLCLVIENLLDHHVSEGQQSSQSCLTTFEPHLPMQQQTSDRR